MKIVNVRALLLNSEKECDKLSFALSTAHTISDKASDVEGTEFYEDAMQHVSDLKQSIKELKANIGEIQK
jgi:hypothetical protein